MQTAFPSCPPILFSTNTTPRSADYSISSSHFCGVAPIIVGCQSLIQNQCFRCLLRSHRSTAGQACTMTQHLQQCVYRSRQDHVEAGLSVVLSGAPPKLLRTADIARCCRSYQAFIPNNSSRGYSIATIVTPRYPRISWTWLLHDSDLSH